MKTKEEIEAAFRADLSDLLKKYNAELQAEDHYPGYAECGEDVRMTAYIPAVYDLKTGEMVSERVEVDLARFVGGYASFVTKKEG